MYVLCCVCLCECLPWVWVSRESRKANRSLAAGDGTTGSIEPPDMDDLVLQKSSQCSWAISTAPQWNFIQPDKNRILPLAGNRVQLEMSTAGSHGPVGISVGAVLVTNWIRRPQPTVDSARPWEMFLSLTVQWLGLSPWARQQAVSSMVSASCSCPSSCLTSLSGGHKGN